MATTTRNRSTSRTEQATRVLLAGDRFLLLEALRAALMYSQIEIGVSGVDRSLDEALAAFRPQVVVIDVSRASIEASARTIRQLVEPDRQVIAISSESVSVKAARIVGAGADCVLGLDAALDEFTIAIQRATAGKANITLERRYELETILRKHRASEQRRWLPFDELTERERQVFKLVYGGLSAEQIADQECVSINTVRTHIRSILAKLNVNSQLAAVALARSNEWFPADQRV